MFLMDVEEEDEEDEEEEESGESEGEAFLLSSYFLAVLFNKL